jgi:hypothetical protein
MCRRLVDPRKAGKARPAMAEIPGLTIGRGRIINNDGYKDDNATTAETFAGGSGLTFFAICHQTGGCDVMGDSGRNPLEGAALRNARAVAAEIKKA